MSESTSTFSALFSSAAGVKLKEPVTTMLLSITITLVVGDGVLAVDPDRTPASGDLMVGPPRSVLAIVERNTLSLRVQVSF